MQLDKFIFQLVINKHVSYTNLIGGRRVYVSSAIYDVLKVKEFLSYLKLGN